MIKTWVVFCKEIHEQFLPGNTEWVAHDSLKKLKHTGIVRDYALESNSLMLDTKHMSEEDKLSNFMSGLQP